MCIFIYTDHLLNCKPATEICIPTEVSLPVSVSSKYTLSYVFLVYYLKSYSGALLYPLRG